MRSAGWLLTCSALLLLAMVLFLAPPRFEGPTLIRLGPRHAFTGMDLVALVPLMAGLGLAFRRLLGRPRSSVTLSAAPPLWAFVAGLALGLALAARFPYLAVHWPVAVGLLLFLLLAGLFASRPA